MIRLLAPLWLVMYGIVTSISANEIQVDIGAKQTGFVKLSELTDDSSAKVEDLVEVGDELDLIVEKVMDQEDVYKRQVHALDHQFHIVEVGTCGGEAGAGLDVVRACLADDVAHRFLLDRKSTRLNSSHSRASRMPSSA